MPHRARLVRRRLPSLPIGTAFALGLLLVATAAPASSPEAGASEDPAADPGARDEVLALVLGAHGGREELVAFPGFRARGKILSVAGGINGSYRLSLSLEGAMRTVIRYPTRTEVRILSGPLAWNGGPNRQRPASTEMADSMRLQYHRWAAPFEIARSAPEDFRLDGESPEGWIRLVRTWAGGLTTTYEIDAESGAIHRVRGEMSDGGHPIEFVTEAADWREIDGIPFPFRTTTIVAGAVAAETILDRVVRESEFPGESFRPAGLAGDL